MHSSWGEAPGRMGPSGVRAGVGRSADTVGIHVSIDRHGGDVNVLAHDRSFGRWSYQDRGPWS